MERSTKTKINEQAFFHLEKCLGNITQIIKLVIDNAMSSIIEDLNAYIFNNQTVHNNEETIIKDCLSFKAVMLYRIAHEIHNDNNIKDYLIIARQLSEYAKALSGIEIHPNAMIGKGFIIDQGYGVVIGETSIIGNNCYIQNKVTLGARGISNNPKTSRHPIIGNNVQIRASAKIYGNIEIGDNCFIGPDVEIIKSVSANSKCMCLKKRQHFNESNYYIKNKYNGRQSYNEN